MYITGSCGVLLIIQSSEWHYVNLLKFSISDYLLAISVLFEKFTLTPTTCGTLARHHDHDTRNVSTPSVSFY
jgi:hypothetical protein